MANTKELKFPQIKRPLRYRNPELAAKIDLMRFNLYDLTHMVGMPAHEAFPRTVLQYHLLAEDDIDSLAHYYSQSTPDAFTFIYPKFMNWDKVFLARPTVSNEEWDEKKEEWQLSTTDRMTIKRRMLGKFIGLLGCETPLWEMEAKLTWLQKRVEMEVREEKNREEREMQKFS